MKNKKIILIVVAVLVIILGGFGYWSVNHSNPTANWKTYTNTQYGVTFKYPDDWQTSEDMDKENSLFNIHIDDFASHLSDQIQIVTPAVSGFVNKGSISANTSELAQTVSGLTQAEQISLAGGIGYYSLDTAGVTGDSVPTIYIVTNNQTYLMSYFGTPGAAGETFFKTFLSTLQFTN